MVVVASVLLTVLLIGSGLVSFRELPIIVFASFWLGATAAIALVPGLTPKGKLRRFAVSGALTLVGVFWFEVLQDMTGTAGYTEGHAAIRQEAEMRTSGGN